MLIPYWPLVLATVTLATLSIVYAIATWQAD